MSNPDAPLSPGLRPRLSPHVPVPAYPPRSALTRFSWGPQGHPFSTWDPEGGLPEKVDAAPDSSTSPDSGVDLSPTDLVCPKVELAFPPEVEVVKPVEKSKGRVSFSNKQLIVMHDRFQQQKYLSPMQIQELATSLGLTYKQVKTWFQNRRTKSKKFLKNTFKDGNMLQCDFLAQTCSEQSPGFSSGYSVHARKSAVGPVNQFQNFGHHNGPCMLVPEETAVWWNTAGVQPIPGSHFNRPDQGEHAATQEMDFWQNFLMLDGMSQDAGYNYSPHLNFPSAPGVLYPCNKMLQHYPPLLQKCPPQNYQLLNYPHLERGSTNVDISEEI